MAGASPLESFLFLSRALSSGNRELGLSVVFASEMVRSYLKKRRRGICLELNRLFDLSDGCALVSHLLVANRVSA